MPEEPVALVHTPTRKTGLPLTATPHRYRLSLAQRMFRLVVRKAYVRKSAFAADQPVGRPSRARAALTTLRPGCSAAEVLYLKVPDLDCGAASRPCRFLLSDPGRIRQLGQAEFTKGVAESLRPLSKQVGLSAPLFLHAIAALPSMARLRAFGGRMRLIPILVFAVGLDAACTSPDAPVAERCPIASGPGAHGQTAGSLRCPAREPPPD